MTRHLDAENRGVGGSVSTNVCRSKPHATTRGWTACNVDVKLSQSKDVWDGDRCPIRLREQTEVDGLEDRGREGWRAAGMAGGHGEGDCFKRDSFLVPGPDAGLMFDASRFSLFSVFSVSLSCMFAFGRERNEQAAQWVISCRVQLLLRERAVQA